MLKKLQKSRSEGFTIIEVMIVLAIAALILLIVLLAVPALQRNARNTAIKNDASALAGGISTFESDNDGLAVTATGDVAQTGATVKIGATGTSQAQAKVQAGDTVAASLTAPTGPLQPGTISVVLKKTCSGTASNRAVAIWYSIETAGAVPTASPWNNKCIDT